MSTKRLSYYRPFTPAIISGLFGVILVAFGVAIPSASFASGLLLAIGGSMIGVFGSLLVSATDRLNFADRVEQQLRLLGGLLQNSVPRDLELKAFPIQGAVHHYSLSETGDGARWQYCHFQIPETKEPQILNVSWLGPDGNLYPHKIIAFSVGVRGFIFFYALHPDSQTNALVPMRADYPTIELYAFAGAQSDVVRGLSIETSWISNARHSRSIISKKPLISRSNLGFIENPEDSAILDVYWRAAMKDDPPFITPSTRPPSSEELSDVQPCLPSGGLLPPRI